jgi:hypothetical protein
MATAQPWTPQVIWQQNGAGDSSLYGASVFAMGDQDDDGYMDWGVIVGGQWGQSGTPNEPRVELFHGGNPPSNLPYLTFRPRSNEYEVYGGASGDLNGDGHIDLCLQRQLRANGDTNLVEIYYGGPGMDTIPNLIFHAPSLLLGYLLPMRDFNGDSFDDLYVYVHGNPNRGLVFFGGNPMDTLPDWAVNSSIGHDYLPYAQTFGDLNGDGFDDFVSYSVWTQHMLYIFHGAALPDTSPAAIWNTFADFPARIINDLNGDGRAELVSTNSAEVHIHWGAQTISPTPDAVLSWPGCTEYPLNITSVGDLNRDGYKDFAVLSDYCDDDPWGKLCVYFGGPTPSSSPALEILGNTAPTNLMGIKSAAGLGDINGDSLADFAVGAWDNNPTGLRGHVVIVSGLAVNAEGPRSLVSRDLAMSVYPNPFNAQATVSLEIPRFCDVVRLTVFNLLGQAVHEGTLRNVIGSVHYPLDATAMSSGIYLLRASAGSMQTMQKLVVLK